ncbi:hypothetical protein DXG03_007257 [Asterophora parasitica]|uniref:Glutaredoxin domain-containing protein n=1 Tax=Asterophora parasitica TaxID=117018 RepID=A0A9P7FZ78_9AGAR|nr:hypothetical protein DXG03_007257 [Asterophora parasitica]
MSTPPTSRAPVRRRRFFIFLALLVVTLFFIGVPWELPSSLKDAGLSAFSRANIAHLTKSKESAKIDEIFGLLHMVTEDVERDLSEVEDLDSSQSVDMTVYAGGEKVDWSRVVKNLNKKYPVVVFSKVRQRLSVATTFLLSPITQTYCPYSRRAKKLLETYNIQPPPKVIEVDLRRDSDMVKNILGRLTLHYTFPNVIIRGQSIGGSDDIQALHAQGQLTKVLQRGGAVVGKNGTGK